MSQAIRIQEVGQIWSMGSSLAMPGLQGEARDSVDHSVPIRARQEKRSPCKLPGSGFDYVIHQQKSIQLLETTELFFTCSWWHCSSSVK